jgi:integrase
LFAEAHRPKCRHRYCNKVDGLMGVYSFGRDGKISRFFEITEQSRNSVEAWLPMLRAIGSRYLFPSRLHARPHISTRQYARLVHRWVESVGLESASYGTHSMRRTKAAQIYRKTGNLRAVQILLGHTKLESTVRYLGIEVDDALKIAEQIEL